jgi:drug/metabolite transporter (DMT)-like permease
MKFSAHPLATGGFLITLIGAVMLSTKAIFVKLAFQQTSVDALSLLALRMIFSLPFYLLAVWWSRRKQLAPLSRKQILYIIGLGIMGYYVSSLLDFMGLQYISAGLERLVLFLYPTFAILINYFLFRQSVSKLQHAALFLTYSGIILAFLSELNFESGSPSVIWGSFLVLLCAITFSIYIVGTGRLVQQVDSTLFTAYAMLAATFGIFVHFALRGNYQVFNMDTSLWWYGILLAIIATVIPSFLVSEGMKRIGSNNVAIILAVGPVSTILQAYFFLGERITMLQITGTILVIAGVLLIGWKRKTAIP